MRFFPFGVFPTFLRRIVSISYSPSYPHAISSISRVSNAEGLVNEECSSFSEGAELIYSTKVECQRVQPGALSPTCRQMHPMLRSSDPKKRPGAWPGPRVEFCVFGFLLYFGFSVGSAFGFSARS